MWPDLLDTLLLRSHNTRVVVLGTALLGLAAGVVGTFAYLRKRALMSDALSHATLPGIALAFLLTETKSLPVLVGAAAISGSLGVLAVLGLRRISRLHEDAAIGIVLSVFFGAGMVLMSVIQIRRTGNAAGLNTFIYGQAAAMLQADMARIAVCTVLILALSGLFFKEFRLVCFDAAFAAAIGLPVLTVDLIMMGLVVGVTVVGLQAVGLILIVALLIIPAAAARFWSDDLRAMVGIAAAIGAASGWLGATLSALDADRPTGALIVVCAGVFFGLSMMLAPRRGVVAQRVRQWSLRRRISRQHLLRAFAEHEERTLGAAVLDRPTLMHCRSWTAGQLERLLRRTRADGSIAERPHGRFALTGVGRTQAMRVLHNHRLWETYLIRYADIAPSHVDRDADEVEHVLSDELVQELEAVLQARHATPPSPHAEEISP